MGLFGGKDDTKAKIEELKAKMQGGAPQGAPQQQQWQQPPQQPQPQQPPQQSYSQPQQGWQPPRESPQASQDFSLESMDMEEISSGIILDLGDGMSLNLPVKSRMRLDEFLRIADRVRELKKIEHPQHY